MSASGIVVEVSSEQHEPGARADDGISIALLYEQYLDRIFGYVLSRVPNQTEAEDITAETFVAAISALPRFRRQSSSYAWLLGIARQKIAEALRRRERIHRRELLEGDLSEQEREVVSLLFASDFREIPEEALLHQEARQVVWQLVNRLAEPQREALLLQVVQGLTIQEIAQVMGRSIAATNSLLQRARRAIFLHGANYFDHDN